MPKARSAILSSLRGSLRGGPTFRDTTQTDAIVMQTRPVPTDRRTAKQAAVRDAYSRLAYLWKNLSHLDKEPYEIMAEARNLTPWNCWLSFHLPLMRLTPKFYTVFAEGAGSTVQNFAIDGETGSINGPVWQEKNQFPCLYFDGIDDRLLIDTPGRIDSSTEHTIYLLFRFSEDMTGSRVLLSTRDILSTPLGFALFRTSAKFAAYRWGDGATNSELSLPYPIQTNELTPIVITQTPSEVTISINQNRAVKTTSMIPLSPSQNKISIFNSALNGFPTKGSPYVIATFPYILPDPTIATLDAHYRPFFT